MLYDPKKWQKPEPEQPMNFRFEEVPPPKTVPVQERAKSLGLLDGLRAEENQRGGWRCAECNTYQKDGAVLVWVPDSVRRSDRADEIKDQCRRSAYNGAGSGWCLSCARALGKGFFARLFS